MKYNQNTQRFYLHLLNPKHREQTGGVDIAVWITVNTTSSINIKLLCTQTNYTIMS